MGQKLVIGAGLALLIAAGWVLFVTGNGEDAHTGGASLFPARAGSPGSKSARNGRGDSDPVEAAKQLRHLLDAPLDEAPTFDAVDRLARHLTDDDLQELIREVGLDEHEGLIGWVRSAAIAEWARRDPEAALAGVKKMPGNALPQNYPLQQAWFAVFRGWAETDPAAALAALQLYQESALAAFQRQLESPSGSREDHHPSVTWLPEASWIGHARPNIFENYARHDAEAAWAAAPSDDPPDADALTGIFRGLPTAKAVDVYAARWSEAWSTPEAEKRQADFGKQLRSSFSGWIITPPDEIIGKEVAMALARFDLAAARDYLRDTGPGSEQDRTGRSSEVLQAWATEFPERALELLDDPAYEDWQTTFARGILDADPEFGIEIMGKIETHGARARSLLTGISPLGSNHVRDFFPVPGHRNRLPDFERRYEAMLETIEAGRFKEGQKQILLKNTHREFQHKIPAAKEAWEALEEK